MFNHDPFEDYLDYVPAKQLALADVYRDATAVIDALGWDPEMAPHTDDFEVPLDPRPRRAAPQTPLRPPRPPTSTSSPTSAPTTTTNAAVMSDIHANRHSVEALNKHLRRLQRPDRVLARSERHWPALITRAQCRRGAGATRRCATDAGRPRPARPAARSSDRHNPGDSTSAVALRPNFGTPRLCGQSQGPGGDQDRDDRAEAEDQTPAAAGCARRYPPSGRGCRRARRPARRSGAPSASGGRRCGGAGRRTGRRPPGSRRR